MNQRYIPFALAFFVAVVTALVFLPALRNDFVWDDKINVVDNLHIRSFDAAFLKWAFTDISWSWWQPLVWISHAVDYALWGLHPAGHHLTNIMLHAVNAFLVVVLAVKLLEAAAATSSSAPGAGLDSGHASSGNGRIFIAAGIAGLLFGIHPLRVESVVWITERKDVLSGFFYLLSLVSYIRYAECAGGATHFFLTRRYLVCLGFASLAFMTKPAAVTIPLIMLLFDWYPLGRLRKEQVWILFREKLPFLALSLLAAAITLEARGLHNISVSAHHGLLKSLLVACRGLVFSLEKILWPVDLLPLYVYPVEVSFVSMKYLVPFLLVAVISAACLFFIRRLRVLAAVWGYYILTFLPVSGIVPFGPQEMADRFTYLPGLGPTLLLGLAGAALWGLAGSRAGDRLQLRPVAGLAAVSVCALLSLLTIKQTGIWKNDLEFWTHITENEAYQTPLAYNNRGLALMDSGHLDRAVEDFNTALGLAVTQKMEYMTYNNRGAAFLEKGQLDRAIEDFTASIAVDSNRADVYLNRGRALMQTGRHVNAVEDFGRALSLKPDYDTYTYRGMALKELGEYESAVSDYTAAIHLAPLSFEAFNNRGVAYKHLGRLDDAVADYGRAIGLNPSFYLAYCNRGIVLAAMGRHEDAVRDYTRAISLKPDLGRAYLDRANLFQKTGNHDLALRDFQLACTLGEDAGCRMSGANRKP